ncbi:MAG: hypothetical protein FD160_987 [Caulobacteraceae bacterium]|nr:MAG: hypothetical protein FD160_987 [Caulobacteraceae bacterium]
MLAELKEGAKRNPIWFGAVATITGVQGFFAWEFWGAVSPDPMHQAALRALGLGFVAGEVVALDMASRADLADENKRANTLRALWMVLAVTTFTADINALSGVLRDGDGARAEAAAAYDAQQARLEDLERRIEAADDPYDERLLSVAAYDASMTGKRREIATARRDGARSSQLRRLEAELTNLQAARATAVETAGWEAERERLRAMPALHAPRPATGPQEFQPFAEMMTTTLRSAERMVGRAPNADVSAEDVRSSMAWVATIAMKLMLTFGVWGGLSRGRTPNARQPVILETEEHRAPAPPQRPDARKPAQAPRTQPRRRTGSHTVFGRGGARVPR